jgi:hypothetical protein
MSPSVSARVLASCSPPLRTRATDRRATARFALVFRLEKAYRKSLALLSRLRFDGTTWRLRCPAGSGRAGTRTDQSQPVRQVPRSWRKKI